MDILPNTPLKEETSEGVFPRLVAADRLTMSEPSEGSGPHPSSACLPRQNLQGENLRGAQIPIAELKLLAAAHGMSDRASVDKRTSRSRVYVFFAAMIGIAAFVAWQSGATEKPNTALASSVTTEIAPATSDLGASDPSELTNPTNIKSNVSLAPPAVPSSEAERLDVIVNELAVVRQELKQLAANHEELARHIAALRPTRETNKQKLPPSVSRAAPSQGKISSTPPLQVGPLPSAPSAAPPTNQTAIADRANIPRPTSPMTEN
jgi:hypothetical protein